MVARANTRYLTRKFILSPEHRRFKTAAIAELAKMGFPRLSGPLVVELHTYWPRLRWLDDGGYPLGDIDATIKSTLDAISDGAPQRPLNIDRTIRGLFDDDIRVVELHAFKHYDATGHRIEVIVRPCASFVPVPAQKKRQTSSSSPAFESLAAADGSCPKASIKAGKQSSGGPAVKTTRTRKHSNLRCGR